MNTDHVDTIIRQWKHERPDIDVSSMAVLARVVRLERMMNTFIQRSVSKYQLTLGEFDVLSALRRSGDPYTLTPTDLFRLLLRSSGGMTNRIDKLEQSGLVTRTPDLKDRRGILVALTPKGLEVINKAIEDYASNLDMLIEPLTKKELADLEGLLRKLLSCLENK